jgi:hypothetical protein
MLMIGRIQIILLALFMSQSVLAKEIIEGIEFKPKRGMAFHFVPIVLPDLFSAKLAFEYKLHKKMNLVVPIEAKWMDYAWAIQLGGKIARKFGAKVSENIPQKWYEEDEKYRPGWNFNYSHFKISTGIGLKFFPFSESMQNAFFIKNIMLIGVERFEAFGAEGVVDGAVLTHALTVGYAWVKANSFTLGIEVGEEVSVHSNAMKDLPRPFFGFSPLLQFFLGFNI